MRVRWYSLVAVIVVPLVALGGLLFASETLGGATRPSITATPLPDPTRTPAPTVEPVATPPAAPEPQPVDTPTPTPEPTPDAPVVLAFGGDVHFEGFLRERLLADPEGVLMPLAEVMGAADLAVVNLETAITTGGVPEPKDYTFRAPPVALDALEAAGVDAVSLANNHGVDYGQSGLADTLDAIDASDLALIGAGRDRTEALTPLSVEIRGVRIAILAATQVLDGFATVTWVATDDRPGVVSALGAERTAFTEAVAAADATHDVVVAFMHWGIERENCPAGAQISIANDLVAAGADVIVGTHTHRVQADGTLAAVTVHYGMGNLVFYAPAGHPGTESGIMLVEIDPATLERTHRWQPATLVDGVANPDEPDAERNEELAATAAERRDCAFLEP